MVMVGEKEAEVGKREEEEKHTVTAAYILT